MLFLSAWRFGGRKGLTFIDEILQFHPATGSVKVMGASLPSGRDVTSAVWDGKNAYIFGGYDGRLATEDILRFDPVADECQVMNATMPSGRYGTSAIWDGTNAYVFGGVDKSTSFGQVLRCNVRDARSASLLPLLGTVIIDILATFIVIIYVVVRHFRRTRTKDVPPVRTKKKRP